MPFGVSKTPGSNDPRNWNWLPYGWEFGAVSPYKYFLKSSGITLVFQRLNNGLVLPIYSNTPDVVRYQLWDFYPFGPTWDMWVRCYNTPQTPTVGPDYTVEWELVLQFPGHVNPQRGIIRYLYPPAIAERMFFMIDDGTGLPSTYIPNPVTMTPVIWSTPVSPAG